MSTPTHTFGPDNATLTVRTGKAGAASKAGHDLQIEVQRWSATLQTASASAAATLIVSADSHSLRVLNGTGGIKPLDDDDKANIEQTIDEEVLKGGTIDFQSTGVEPNPDGRRMNITGNLNLLGTTAPIVFELTVDSEGHVTAEAVVTQSAWGMKPYSALFGTLKVADEVRISLAGRLG